MSLVKVTKGFSIKIPKSLRAKMRLKEGDQVQIEMIKPGEAVLRALNAEKWANAVIAQAMRETSHRDFDEKMLDHQFDEMQEAIWSRTESFSNDEVEEDVMAAIKSVRAERGDRKRAS